jgi:4-methyl-5(b-hydroxyethyl)-thiazole monophosphate biosynthesis
MAKNVLVLLAEGFEEVEAVTPIDYLRRVNINVTVAALGTACVTGSHGIPIIADTTVTELEKQKKLNPFCWDALVLPGGSGGAANLAASQEIGTLLKEMAGADKWVCAICASPVAVLAPLGLLEGKKFTCFPGMEKNITRAAWSKDRVVVDENPRGGGLITSRGAGTAGDFAVAIISNLIGSAEGEKLAQGVLLGSAD